MVEMDNVKALAIAVQANVPVLLWGAPGIGKTSRVQSLAEQLNMWCEVVISSIREPSDFGGLPIVSDDGVKFAPPSWAKRLAEKKKGILFIDEISTAPPAVQAALLRVVLDRVVGELPLPEGISIVAAANPPEQAAGGWELSAPLANRFVHLQWGVDVMEWVDGMVSGWKDVAVSRLPENWKEKIPAARAQIASFVRSRPHLLLQVPNEESKAGKAWPSPRSWDMAARLQAAVEAAGESEEVLMALICGAVGEGVGIEYLTWKRELDLPDPEELLADPSKYVHPDRGDKVFAVLSSVATAAVQNLTPERWLAAWEVIGRAVEAGAADMAASAARILAKNRRHDLPMPSMQLKSLLPVLKLAGMV